MRELNEFTKTIQKDAWMLLSKIKKGVINIPELEGFLVRVGNYQPPTRKQKIKHDYSKMR
jgi:hypothetical protein